MGGCLNGSSGSRGPIKIVFSSTTGTSKKAAGKLQQLLEDNRYQPTIVNVGDFDREQLKSPKATVLFLLSTYGNGDSPADGESFLKWLEGLKPTNQFQGLEYAILAFGSSDFENHCGFGLRTEKQLKAGGGKELLALTKCDSSSKANNFDGKYPDWSSQLIKVLNSNHPLAQTTESSPQGYSVTLQSRNNFDWEANALKMNNLSKEFTSFLQMPKCKVIHIKEMRKDVSDGRSTLWVRVQLPKGVTITPACNIDIFPINEVPVQPNDDQIATFSAANSKLPFPPMPVTEIKRIANYSQTASPKQIKTAIQFSTATPDKIAIYQQQLDRRQDIAVTCRKLAQDLKPGVEFLPELGVNSTRTYTLASWDATNSYLDLCVALVKDGLTSNYLSRKPTELRIRSVHSTFTMAGTHPIVMVANGSGIAPFRSIAQYYASMPQNKRASLRLYYGIQSEEVDYYFGQEWKQLEKDGIVELRIAESRRDPKKKTYVQDALRKDKEWLADHFFARQGILLMCGGRAMSKSIHEVILEAASTRYPAGQASTQVDELWRSKRIVEQVYG